LSISPLSNHTPLHPGVIDIDLVLLYYLHFH
jgi:hypothetical protein